MSEDKYTKLGLQKFEKLVDGIINDLEEGRLKGEDVKPKHQPKTIEDTIIKSTATEIGEEGYDENNLEVIGKVGKRMVKVTPADGSTPTIYGSPSVAARKVGLTPTTIKQRADNQKVDSKGNLWEYLEPGE